MGNPDGDGDSDDDYGIPSSCNVNDDCPEEFLCTDHKCTPNEPPVRSGCDSAPGVALTALALLLGLGLVRRRRG